MTGQQDVNTALYQVAGRALADSQYELAVRCLVAVLDNEPDPDEFAQCSLDLGRIYIEHTEDTQKAQERLLQLHVRIKDHPHRLDQKCSCCSLLVKAAMKAGDGTAASKACTKAMKILGRVRGAVAELEPWWLHFGCQAASMAQLNAQDWNKLCNKALNMLTNNVVLAAQLLCAVLQAQLSSGSLSTCVGTLRHLQQTISRWPPDPGPQAREIQAHALTLQALLMMRESQAGCCWNIPVCSPQPSEQQDAGEGEAGTSQGAPTRSNGAADQHTVSQTVPGPLLSAVLDELQVVQNLTGSDTAYGWLCVRSQVALIMLLRAADALAQHSSGKDSSGNSALFYADSGLEVLSECTDIQTNPTLLDLRVLLESVAFLFYITAFSGKSRENHLESAQKALATLQSHSLVATASYGSTAPDTENPDAASGAKPATARGKACASNATPPVPDAHVQPSPAASTFARNHSPPLFTLETAKSTLIFCTVCGLMGGPPGLLLLSVLMTTTLCNALSDINTSEAQTEVAGLLATLQNLLDPDSAHAVGGKLENFLTAMARARSFRPGPEASSYLEKRAPRWQEHKDAVLKAFQLSSQFIFSEAAYSPNQQFPGKHQQLVVAALRTLGPVLASEGDTSGVEKVMKHALQLLNVAPDGTARVAVLRDYVRHCLLEDSDKRAPALTRVQAYADAVVAGMGPEHTALLKWGLGGADEG